jgi:DNA-binding MarR family transcriptional regulator
VLATLWAVGGGPLPLSEISRFLVTTRTNVTGLVDRLEVATLLERRPNPDDRRSTLVSLTATGSRLVRRILGGYFDRLDAAMSGLAPDERLTLLRLLAKVSAGFRSDAKVKRNERRPR